MAKKKNHHPVIVELAALIKKNKWQDRFNKAIKSATSKNVPLLNSVTNLDQYLEWMNSFIYWVPSEVVSGKDVYNHICASYFILDQDPLLSLQTKLEPHQKMPPITPLSKWIVKYANSIGEFLDTPESLTGESEESFYKSPRYNMGEYTRPHGGWRTFNQFFARNVKPGYRPVAGLCDQTVIVSPADSTFDGQWEIRTNSHVTIKNLHWRISELLEGSPYKDRFKNGIFMHSFLNTTDYHRQHAPLGGKVLEARVIQGQAYLEVEAVENPDSGHSLRTKRNYDAPDNPGYQFDQCRGLIVLETPIGLVAVLPMGMAQVSSVIVTAEVGITLRKGEEISYFQFGGSDIVVLFEATSNVSLTAQMNVHYKMGAKIGQAFPV